MTSDYHLQPLMAGKIGQERGTFRVRDERYTWLLDQEAQWLLMKGNYIMDRLLTAKNAEAPSST